LRASIDADTNLAVVADVAREDTPHGLDDGVYDQIPFAPVQVARDLDVPVALRRQGYPQGPTVLRTQADTLGVQNLEPQQRYVASVSWEFERDLVEVEIP